MCQKKEESKKQFKKSSQNVHKIERYKEKQKRKNKDQKPKSKTLSTSFIFVQ
jgi:hypothetical protein